METPSEPDFSHIARPAINTLKAYVPGKPIEEVERELGISGAIKMASNENPLGPSPAVMEAIAQAAHKVALYPDANAFLFKQALTRHVALPAEHFLVGNGLDDVLRIIAETYFCPGDEVVIPAPSFSLYEHVTLLTDAVPVIVTGKYENDLEAMAGVIGSATKAVFICNPNNPTGSFVSHARFEWFLANIPSHVLVILDEAYADFADHPDMAHGLGFFNRGYGQLIVLRTFSKLYGMAGLRLGYAIARKEIIGCAMRVKEPFNVNSIALSAGIAALADSEHVLASKALVHSERMYFYNRLAELGLDYVPTQANFILINCDTDTAELCDYLLHQGIIVRPTHSFGLPHCIRVTFGTRNHNELFFEHLAAWLTLKAPK